MYIKCKRLVTCLSCIVIYLLFLSSTQIDQAQTDLDRLPTDNEVDYFPGEGEITAVNPPAFIWLPAKGIKSYILQYSQSPSFDPPNTITVRDINITVHIPTELIPHGTWYWRFGYHDNSTNVEVFSKSRRFVIPENTTAFPFIPAEELLGRIPKTRPRLHFSPEMVRDIRMDTEGRYAHITSKVIEDAQAILLMDEPLFEEPRPWEEYENPRYAYVNAFAAMRPYTQRMVTCALAYLYTGDKHFAAEARRRLMHFMDWDVQGTSKATGPTELGMDIAANAPPVFDYIYDTLSDEDIQKCLKVLTARMHQISYDVHRSRPMESQPYSSHPGRMIGFVVEGSIVLAHEVPEVEDWLDYTLKLLWSIYPAWGRTDGGWHEGISYWSSYMRRMMRVVNELNRYNIPLKDKPFFQNTGYFGLYAAYPNRPTKAFGDDPYGPVGAAQGQLMYDISKIYENPYFRWHAVVSGTDSPGGIAAILFDDNKTEQLPPADIPQSRAFFDVGLVAMHSNMAEPENNVTMLFQSNPFGSISHNHACQNAFVIEAYGEPLAITSGSRQLHGSPHHSEWMWHTKAHNSILVDNEGQVARRKSSRGKIILYQENGDHMMATGDATEAYGGRLERFHRHILFIRPDYFVIVDDLKTTGKSSTFQWLLHSPTEYKVDKKNKVIVNQSGSVRLTTRILTPGDIDFTMHTGFTPSTERPSNMINQFHLTASTVKQASAQHFVTIMRVNRAEGNPVEKPSPPSSERKELPIRDIGDLSSPDQTILEAKLLKAKGGVAIRMGNDLILWKEPDARRVKAAGITSDNQMEYRKNYYKK